MNETLTRGGGGESLLGGQPIMATPTWTTSDGDRFFFRGSARQVREAAYVLAGPEQVKRDLWKAVTDGNVDNLRQYQQFD